MDRQYSMRKLSQVVDVSVGMLRKWAYDGFIVPNKTPLGHFRYNDSHIAFIKADDFLSKRNEFYNKLQEEP